jgi:hypothetical protein
VKAAVDALRISADQKFFPRPDEIAAEIYRQRDRRQAARDVASAAIKRQQQIEEFWKWAPTWMEDTGNDEAELLERWPAYKGTKPAQVGA